MESCLNIGGEYQHWLGALLYKMGKNSTKHNHYTQHPTWATAALPFSGFGPLSPWQHLPWTQFLTPLLPIGPYKAHGVGCALAIVDSFIWGAKMQPLKKQREGRGLSLRWPPFEHTTQQPTTSPWSQWGGYSGGRTTWGWCGELSIEQI